MRAKSPRRRTYSSELVQVLVKRGYTVARIARAAGLKRSFITQVRDGSRELTSKRIARMGRSLDEPLAWLWFKSIPIKSIPKGLRPLHEMTKKILKPRRAPWEKAAK